MRTSIPAWNLMDIGRGQAQDPEYLDPVRLMLVARDGADRRCVTVGVCAPHRSYDVLVGQQTGREKFAKGVARITGR